MEKYTIAGSDEKKKKVRAEFDELEAKIELQGETFSELYRFYDDSIINGNAMLNIENIIRSDINDFIEEINKNEIKAFTFTSTWSSAVEVIAAFIDAGFRVTGTDRVCTYKTKWDEVFKTALVFSR